MKSEVEKKLERKLYTVYPIKNKQALKNGIKYKVYKREFGRVQITYYSNKKIAEENKNWIAI